MILWYVIKWCLNIYDNLKKIFDIVIFFGLNFFYIVVGIVLFNDKFVILVLVVFRLFFIKLLNYSVILMDFVWVFNLSFIKFSVVF